MTLREMVLSIDFEEWVEKKSFELFGERSEYIGVYSSRSTKR